MEYNLNKVSVKEKEKWEVKDLFFYDSSLGERDLRMIVDLDSPSGRYGVVNLYTGTVYYLAKGYKSIDNLMSSEYPHAVKVKQVEPLELRKV